MGKGWLLLLVMLLLPGASAHGPLALQEPFTRLAGVDPTDSIMYGDSEAQDLVHIDVWETFDATGEPGIWLRLTSQENDPVVRETTLAFTVNGTGYEVDWIGDAALEGYSSTVFSEVIYHSFTGDGNQHTVDGWIPYAAIEGAQGAAWSDVLATSTASGAVGDYYPGGCGDEWAVCAFPFGTVPAMNEGPEPTTYTLQGATSAVDIACDHAAFALEVGEEASTTCTFNSTLASADVLFEAFWAGVAGDISEATVLLAPGESVEVDVTLSSSSSGAVEARLGGLASVPVGPDDLLATGVQGARFRLDVAPAAPDWDGAGDGDFNATLLPGQAYAWRFTETGRFLVSLDGTDSVGAVAVGDGAHIHDAGGALVVTAPEGVPALHEVHVAGGDAPMMDPEEVPIAQHDVVRFVNHGDVPVILVVAHEQHGHPGESEPTPAISGAVALACLGLLGFYSRAKRF